MTTADTASPRSNSMEYATIKETLQRLGFSAELFHSLQPYLHAGPRSRIECLNPIVILCPDGSGIHIDLCPDRHLAICHDVGHSGHRYRTVTVTDPMTTPLNSVG